MTLGVRPTCEAVADRMSSSSPSPLTARDRRVSELIHSWPARVLRRFWKLGIAAVGGLLVGLAIPLLLSMCGAIRTTKPFMLDTQVVAASGPAFDSALYQTVGARMAAGHEIQVLDNGAVFDTLVNEIGHARRSIHIVMYIWEAGKASDRVSAALIARAKAGVACRILVDALGSSKFDDTVQPALVQAGCEVRTFRPMPGADVIARNHRKIAVLDGTVAITGGFGVRDNWLGDGVTDEAWRDTNVRFVGPAVHEAQQAFAENWQEAGGALIPADAFPEVQATGSVRAAFVPSSGSSVVTHAERLTQLVIAAAKRRLWIVNAYFVPSPAILELIKHKALSGVDVRILVPGYKSDSKPALAAQHALYGGLHASGVRVWEYAPSMIHSKTMLADDKLVVIGSINLDPLSLNKLEEAALVIDDAAVAGQLAKSFDADCNHAAERSN